MKWFDWDALTSALNDWGLESASGPISRVCRQRTSIEQHGDLPRWRAAWEQLPQHGQILVDEPSGVVRVEGQAEDLQDLRHQLMEFHPWRKGPFEICGLHIDTEWRSNLKWDRLGGHLDFAGKRVIDVGCGNGYYGWRMLARGAECVLGCDPTLLYVAQSEVLRRYDTDQRHFVIPLADVDLPADLRLFDMAFSMGVLYHRTGPIDHLQKLAACLRTGGELILETLVIDTPDPQVLVPRGRYAKMRNVWFLPSPSMMHIWLARCGFNDIQLIDHSRTSLQEQRRTPWMTFESLADFLDTDNPGLTIEGYPAPQRAIFRAIAR